MGIKSLRRASIGERDGWITRWVIAGVRLLMRNGRLSVAATTWIFSRPCCFSHLQRGLFSKISHVIQSDFYLRVIFISLLPSVLLRPFSRRDRLIRWCFTWLHCCVLAYMPESRPFTPAGGPLCSLCLFNASPLQIHVGLTPSRTTDDSFDGVTDLSRITWF